MNRLLPVLALVLCAALVHAADFDPDLHAKALAYDEEIRTWHTTGLGGLTGVYFTDETRTEMVRTAGAGDSTDWTTFYMVSQALRYRITGEQIAYDEVLRISEYLHIVHAATQDPGYIARYVGLDEPPWNVENLSDPARVEGTGEFAGTFWVGRQSRDKYMHWYWGQTWAYDIIEDEGHRQTIRDDFERVTTTLMDNGWQIIDPWGDTWPAAEIGPDIRMEILLATAHVTGDPMWWDLLDAQFDAAIDILPIAMTHYFNRYFDYYAFINDVPVSNHLFRLWPDRGRLMRFYDAWMQAVRQYQADTHSTLFNAIYYGACLRLGTCDAAQIDEMRADVLHGLEVFYDPPNYQRYNECPEIPLDPFSVWAAEVLPTIPWLDELINISPQTAQAHLPEDRCWSTHLWEVSPYHIACTRPEDPTHTAPGLDYTLAYWFGVYFGLVPGNGPYDDFAFYEPPNWDDPDEDPGEEEPPSFDDDDDDDDDTGTSDDPDADDDDDDETGCGR